MPTLPHEVRTDLVPQGPGSLVPVRGRPFQAGQSGNPAGSSRKARERAAAGKRRLADVVNEQAARGLEVAMRELERLTTGAADERGRLAAAVELRNTFMGCPAPAKVPPLEAQGEADVESLEGLPTMPPLLPPLASGAGGLQTP